MKQIPGFPNYSITDSGHVWSRLRNKWLKSNKDEGGYLKIDLGYGNTKCIHRLILETFVGPCPKGMESCHNDGNKLNNNLSNLRWDTKSNNVKDAIRHGTHVCVRLGEESTYHKLTENIVRNIKKMLQKGIKQNVIAKIYNVHQSTISKINMKEMWNHVYVD